MSSDKDEMYKIYMSGQRSAKNISSLVLMVAAGIGLTVWLLFGMLTINGMKQMATIFTRGGREVLQLDTVISQQIMNSIDPRKIEENLRILSSKPHTAGRSRDFELVSLIQKHFSDHGLRVQTTPYDVLLSYPSKTVRSSVRILDEANHVMYDSVNDESDVSSEEDIVAPYHAYAPAGLVEGEIVYAGYGRHVEYETLLSVDVNVTGKIVLVKYGKIFRGSKVTIAQSYGAIGVVIFSDPADVTGFSRGDHRVHPDTWWLPATGLQRGTVFTGAGDPLTPGSPSNNLAYRLKESQTEPPLPKIPSQPIGYGAAYNILSRMQGPQAPSDWTCGLNVTYRLGPGFKQPGLKLQLNVTNQNQRAKVENVFGIIKGSVEPDRYVLFGNHRDAWVYGALDPSSGTAVMMEMSRVMGDLVKSGHWRPRRSIMFCSWGAEEFGLIGSTEWVEQYVSILRERVVGYINVDTAVKGNHTLQAASMPHFHDVIYKASQQVSNPNPSEVLADRKTVYDTWLQVRNSSDGLLGNDNVPFISTLGSGTDYAPLLHIAGISSVDLSYTFDKRNYDISTQRLYHTEFETFEAVKRNYDRDFQVHAAVAKVASEVVRSLTDSVIIPFNISNYARGIERYRQQLDDAFGLQLQHNVPNYGLLEDVIQNFTKDVKDFEDEILKVDRTNPLLVRSINDRIMLLERAFLIPEGLPLRPRKKHALVAESLYDVYSPVTFPGLLDLLFEIELHPETWEAVRRHFSTLLQTIQSAGVTLRDVTNFMFETL